MLDAEIVAIKTNVIELMDSGQVSNLSQAAEKLSMSKMKLYWWKYVDPEWTKRLDQVNQLIADRLEKEIEEALIEGKPITMPYVTARIFRLKALRPDKYRDNFRFEVVDGKMMQLLMELKKAGQEEPQKQISETKVEMLTLPVEIKEVEEAQK